MMVVHGLNGGFYFFRFEMTDWVDKIREPLDLKRATSLKVQVKYIILYMISYFVAVYTTKGIS